VRKTLLVLLVAVMIPLQGLAAVSAGECMALGHHQHAGDGGHDGHDGDSHSGTDGHGQASHACCAWVSIVGWTAFAAPASPARPQYFVSQSPPSGVQPDGVYRPPLVR
jgi:hypothetical protein